MNFSFKYFFNSKPNYLIFRIDHPNKFNFLKNSEYLQNLFEFFKSNHENLNSSIRYKFTNQVTPPGLEYPNVTLRIRLTVFKVK